MLVKDLIKNEIERRKKELNRLNEIYLTAQGNQVEKCPECKTKNYHYNVKDNSRSCAYCGYGQPCS